MKDLFSQAFRVLIDNTGKFTRNEWAAYLSRSPKVIGKFVRGESIPPPDVIAKTLSYLEGFEDEKIRKALSDFYEMASLPVEKTVSGRYIKRLRKFKAGTVADYVTHDAISRALGYGFSEIPLQHRRTVLLACKAILEAADDLIKTDNFKVDGKTFLPSDEKIRMLFMK